MFFFLGVGPALENFVERPTSESPPIFQSWDLMMMMIPNSKQPLGIMRLLLVTRFLLQTHAWSPVQNLKIPSNSTSQPTSWSEPNSIPSVGIGAAKSIDRFKKRSTSINSPVASMIRKVQGSGRIALLVDSSGEKYTEVPQPSSKSSFQETAQKVQNVLERVTNHSWEWGLQSQVLLEIDYHPLSVFSTSRKLPLSDIDGPMTIPDKLLDLIDPILARRDSSSLPLVEGDGASGDPASLGTAVLVASIVTQKDPNRSQNYKKLAEGQLDWLLNRVPRSPEGAISQRNDQVQFWSDYMYMVPPFLAYYGATSSNFTLLQSAYDQVRLYRSKLQSPSGDTKLWRHIIEGNHEDRLYWSTGNGWAAAGMMRVYATFKNLRDADLVNRTETWTKEIAEWVFEIVNETFSGQRLEEELIPNYMLNTDPRRNYLECAGTALIASAGYRLASLDPSYVSRLPMSAIERSRLALFNKYTNPETGAVAPVVDPLDWNAEKPLNGTTPEVGLVSPEGQGFILLLNAAWNSYTST